MLRPNTLFNDDIAAAIKYHCTKEGIKISKYVEDTVVSDLKKRYPYLFSETSNKKEAAVP